MKNFGPSEYPDDWETSCMWDGKLSVHFGYPEYGWVLLSLLTTAYNGSQIVHLSSVFDPFWDMLEWLNAIAEGHLPASFRIDEEGCYKELIVKPYIGRYRESSDIEFRINGDYWNEEKGVYEEGCFFLSRCSRLQFLNEFAHRLESWLSDDYDKDKWQMDWREYDEPESLYMDLRNLDIETLKAKAARCRTAGQNENGNRV